MKSFEAWAKDNSMEGGDCDKSQWRLIHHTKEHSKIRHCNDSLKRLRVNLCQRGHGIGGGGYTSYIASKMTGGGVTGRQSDLLGERVQYYIL